MEDKLNDHSFFAACRAIARNPRAVVELLDGKQVNRLAAQQEEYEVARSEFESKKRNLAQAVRDIMMNC